MENILSDLGTAYPGFVETLFVFDDETEPTVDLVRAALADKPPPGRERSAGLIFAGAPRAGRTGKLNAMIAGDDAAAGELVAFLDSDLRPGPDDLRLLVETLLGTAGAGAAFAPVVVREPPVTLGDTGYALMLNGLYSPVAAAATLAGEGALPFIMGQFMVFRREALTEIGGLACAEGQLVDDMFLGMRLNAFGHRNLVAPRAVSVVQRGLPLRDFWGVYQRWITFSRSGLPIRTFQIRTWVLPALYWMGLLGALAADDTSAGSSLRRCSRSCPWRSPRRSCDCIGRSGGPRSDRPTASAPVCCSSSHPPCFWASRSTTRSRGGDAATHSTRTPGWPPERRTGNADSWPMPASLTASDARPAECRRS